ncbi:MAG: hypothetical protein ACLUNS_10235 [Alistipes shahii]
MGKMEKRAKVVDLSRGIDLIAGSCSHGSHGHIRIRTGIDPARLDLAPSLADHGGKRLRGDSAKPIPIR